MREPTEAELTPRERDVAAVTDLLRTRYGVTQCHVTAQLLAIIIRVGRHPQVAFPRRQFLAAQLVTTNGTRGVSKYTIDHALRTALARGLIEEDVIVVDHPTRERAVLHRRRFRATRDMLEWIANHG